MNQATKHKLIYLVVYEPTAEAKFKIEPIEFRTLSWKHPLIRKTGAIFADEEYAKQFYNFIVTNAKEQDAERAKMVVEKLSETRDVE